MNLKSHGAKVILASGSPRRLELLGTLCSDFQVIVSEVDETMPAAMDPSALASHLAESKALSVANDLPLEWLKAGGALVIGADTVVSLGHKRLEKPTDPDDAVAMLMELRGRSHHVFTGVCVAFFRQFDGAASHRIQNQVQTGVEKTEVRFRTFNRAEAEAYVQAQNPLDKAGAYGIQDPGFDFAQAVSGPLDNVIGLPRALLCRLVEEAVTAGPLEIQSN